MLDVNSRTTAAKRFSALEQYRAPFLQRAKDCAALSIPALMPPWITQGADNSTPSSAPLPTPWQSVGARGVNNLASKLMMALLPPEAPFFRLNLDVDTRQEIIDARQDPEADVAGDIDKGLSRLERQIQKELENYGLRADAFEIAKQLLSSGNVLLRLANDMPRVYKLNEYVVKRTPKGAVIEILTKEFLSRANMSPELLFLADGADAAREDASEKPASDDVPLYTWVRRRGDKYLVHQELNDYIVPGSVGRERLSETGWLPLRLVKVDGEDYGRSHVEEYIGDLRSLEILSQALVEGAAAMAKILWLVNPGGRTNPKVLSRAPNGAFVNGDVKDLASLQADKFADMQVADSRAEKLERRLSAVFLLTSEMPRDAERVTAEEIRLIADELEDALGGAYSLFTQEFQLPVVKWALRRLRARKVIKPIVTKNVEPKIVTGLEALGRNNELRRLDLLAQGAATFGPEAVSEYVRVGDWLARRATALNIEMEGVLRSEEEVQQRRAERAQREQEQALGPEIIRQAGAQAQQPTQ